MCEMWVGYPSTLYPGLPADVLQRLQYLHLTGQTCDGWEVNNGRGQNGCAVYCLSNYLHIVYGYTASAHCDAMLVISKFSKLAWTGHDKQVLCCVIAARNQRRM